MRNFKNNRRRFRNNSFDKGFKLNSNNQNLTQNLASVSDFKKKSFPRNNFNFSKLIQKYSELAREALSSGDKIMYENYLQHAEHFIRISENLGENSNSKNNSLKELNQAEIGNIKEEESNKQDNAQNKDS
tara:strand:+ start:21 stop:410 length:390 start_codon:yes stop_codon:yes gene_type:complete